MRIRFIRVQRERLNGLVHRCSNDAHRLEHGFHLAYFGGLSTGLLDYHLIAGGCLVLGIVSLLPRGE